MDDERKPITVRELIEILKDFHQDAEVILSLETNTGGPFYNFLTKDEVFETNMYRKRCKIGWPGINYKIRKPKDDPDYEKCKAVIIDTY